MQEDNNFNINDFPFLKELDNENLSLEEKHTFLKSKFTQLGKGSFRTVYDIENNKVLKLINLPKRERKSPVFFINRNIEQNINEYDIFFNTKSSILNPTYYLSTNKEYLIAEKINSLNTFNESKIFTNIKYCNSYVDFKIILNSLYYLQFGKRLFPKKCYILHNNIDLMKEILSDKNNIFNNLFNLHENYNLCLLDIRLRNLGYINNNQIKIIDYGLKLKKK